jgi:hypothetical protein
MLGSWDAAVGIKLLATLGPSDPWILEPYISL